MKILQEQVVLVSYSGMSRDDDTIKVSTEMDDTKY